MATKVETENYLLAHCSMRELSRESNGVGRPPCYTDGSFCNGQFYNGFLPRTISDSHPFSDKYVLKQTMLEHEAIFKDQVYELHRLHRVQRDLMDEARRTKQLKRHTPYEASSSSTPQPSQMRFDDAQRWNGTSFLSGSPVSAKGKSIQADPSPLRNNYSSKSSDASESRPTKFRKRILDLQLPADEYIRKPKVVADLNEPLNIEEMTEFTSAGLLGHAGSHGDTPYRDFPGRLLASSKDTPQNPKKRGLNGTMNSLHDTTAKGQDWFHYALESEQYNASARSINQEIHPEKTPMSSQPVHILLDHAHQYPAFLTNEDIKQEPWKQKSNHNFSMSNYTFTEPILGSHVSTQPGFFQPSDMGRSGAQCATSWVKANFLRENPMSVNSLPFLSARNGFPQGSSAAFNEPAPPARIDYLNCNYSENTRPCKGDINPLKEMNLNVALHNGVSDDYINPHRPTIIDNQCKLADPPLAVLPWLREKGGCSNGSGNSREVGSKAKMPDSNQNFLGVSIIGNPTMSLKPHREIRSSKRNGLFDMNIPCEASDLELDKMPVDDDVTLEKKEIKIESYKNNFDLNSCITEEETPSVKVGAGIDLEALINLENEDDSTDDGYADLAASAIVAISSFVNSTPASMEENICLPPKAEGDDPLHWFVSIACSTVNDVDIEMVENDVLDDFEYMNMRLEECTPEECFPKLSIPDFPTVDNGTCTSTKTRKGQGRRGRQRRDFQRDILPGLTTLSRHEVTKDLQTFGGLMRDMGYSWQFGPNRTRNGRGRGRKRSVVSTPVLNDTVCALPLKQEEVNNNKMEGGVVDRSLTGWGKTTRRPRRQRCPAAGNLAILVPLT